MNLYAPMNAFSPRQATARLALAAALMVGVQALAPVASAQDADEAATPDSTAFFPMFQVSKASGDFLVARPGRSSEPGIPGKAYPFGSRITASKNAKVHVFLAPNRQIQLVNGAEAIIGDDPDHPGAKCAELIRGTVETFLGQDEDETFPFSIVTKAAVFEDFRGRSAVFAADAGASWKAGIHVSSGKATLRAPQIAPSRLGNASHLLVETLKDGSYTCINGVGGDYTLLFENGSDPAYQAPFHPGSLAKIWRSWAPKSHLLAVSVLVVNGDGSVADSYAFNEGQPPIKSGVAPVAEPDEADLADAGAETAVADDELADFGDDLTPSATDDSSSWSF